MPLVTNKLKRRQLGMSLVEVLIVLGVIVALTSFSVLGFNYIKRGVDAKRKDHLEKIRLAFEDYYNDNGCYPTDGVLDSCESATLQPYLRSIPCDPKTDEPYTMISESGACPSWYAVYTILENTTDPSIAKGECASICYVDDGEGQKEYNWAVSSPNYSAWDAAWGAAGCGVGCFYLTPTNDCNVTGSCSGSGCYTGGICNPMCAVSSCP